MKLKSLNLLFGAFIFLVSINSYACFDEPRLTEIMTTITTWETDKVIETMHTEPSDISTFKLIMSDGKMKVGEDVTFSQQKKLEKNTYSTIISGSKGSGTLVFTIKQVNNIILLNGFNLTFEKNA